MDTVVKSLGQVFRPLTMLFCLAFLIAPVLAESNEICFLTVLKLGTSGHAEAKSYVVNDKAAWETLWEKIFAGSSEKPSLPEIDFERRTVLAVFQGTQPTSSYEIFIKEVVESENALEISVRAFSPGKHCGVLGILTRPFHIVEIPKTEKEVVFNVKQKILNCD